ncbi:MAG: tRNA preQ1(34) S-adenosylmethionine ribosyltransferase-isomerase QueA [Candidatus Falkowbacteria bacterium]
MLSLRDFDYNLPKESIAQVPANPRDHSRLLVYNRLNKEILHTHFYDIASFLRPGDVLVVNNTKVFPARLTAHKLSGGAIELFLLRPENETHWRCLLGGRGINTKTVLYLGQTITATVIEQILGGEWLVEFSVDVNEIKKYAFMAGQVPLPPYIKRDKEQPTDKTSYQTVFANDQKTGAVAAPTAGLHFTPELINEVKQKGIAIVEVTLHVGLGTFAPVKEDDLDKHQMHAEWYEITTKTLDVLKKTKQVGGRVIAVGTTSVRVLESIWSEGVEVSNDLNGWTNIFIRPGYTFKVVDAIITNFHLPKSTLLMLVAAFITQSNLAENESVSELKRLYLLAIEQEYRFFSYGDAMLIL